MILTDIKHVLACNPTFPKYQALPLDRALASEQRSGIDIAEGVYQIGYAGPGFAFDNESPRHAAYLHACRIEAQLTTCGEYIEFIEDGGYQRPEHWLSAGWAAANEHRWQAPMYWVHRDGGWMQFTLGTAKQ